MVSFQCEGCGEVIKKQKAEQHIRSCRFGCPAFVCVDCMRRFVDDSYKEHTSCISEAEKYQKSLYKPPKQKGGKQPQKQQPEVKPKPVEPAGKAQSEVKVEKKAGKIHASSELIEMIRKIAQENCAQDSMEEKTERMSAMLQKALKKALREETEK